MCVLICNYSKINYMKPFTVAARSKTRNIFARSNIEIVGLNLTRGMDDFLPLLSVCAALSR
jgi:hypothetical protein